MLRTPKLVKAIENYKQVLWEDLVKCNTLTNDKLEEMGLHPCEISYFIRGKLEKFSLERVLMICLELGHAPKITII